MADARPDARVREPAFNVPWPVGALVGVLIAAHAARVAAGVGVDRWAVTRIGLIRGDWPPLVTYLFVHAGWAHVLMNSVFILAFGAPVARYLGLGARGGLAFAAFFIACGVAAALGYAGLRDVAVALVARPSNWALVGASGAASGLMGGAARLIEGRGRLGGMTGRRVVGMGAGWVVANAVLGLSGLTPGAAGVPVAWEAHIIGFFAGVLMMGAFARLAGRAADHSIAP